MQATAVQTSAQAPEFDLFGPAPALSRAVFEGVLRDDARVLVRAADHGHAQPVLVLELEHVGAGHHRLHVEQAFPHSDRFVADAHAAGLKRGTRVRIVTPLTGSTLVLPHVEQITPLTPHKGH